LTFLTAGQYNALFSAVTAQGRRPRQTFPLHGLRLVSNGEFLCAYVQLILFIYKLDPVTLRWSIIFS
jgi:hypothetical protein